MEESDNQIAARVRSGDREAFRLLVERHSRFLFHVVYRITGHEADADEVVQEAFLRAYRQIGRFDPGTAQFRTWLHRIAVNCALDLLRLRRRQKDDVALDGTMPWRSADPTPERLHLSGQIEQIVEAALREMSSVERTAFLLRHVEGLSIEEIGAALGKETSATKHSIFRAVKKLRAVLAPAMGMVG